MRSPPRRERKRSYVKKRRNAVLRKRLHFSVLFGFEITALVMIEAVPVIGLPILVIIKLECIASLTSLLRTK